MKDINCFFIEPKIIALNRWWQIFVRKYILIIFPWLCEGMLYHGIYIIQSYISCVNLSLVLGLLTVWQRQRKQKPSKKNSVSWFTKKIFTKFWRKVGVLSIVQYIVCTNSFTLYNAHYPAIKKLGQHNSGKHHIYHQWLMT